MVYSKSKFLGLFTLFLSLSIPPPTQPDPADITEEQLDQFARAYLAVQAIQQETQAEMVAAVEAEGLT